MRACTGNLKREYGNFAILGILDAVREMEKPRFRCKRCGKIITAYKMATSRRRKCSGCGSYHVQALPYAPPSSKPSVLQQDRTIPDNKLPSVSVIIPSHNGKHLLKKCLPSLRKLDYPQERVEIIVVDNASRDGTEAFLGNSGYSVKTIQSGVNHYCLAINLGLNAASGDYAALLNNDTEVDPKWLRELVNVIHKNPKVGAVGSKVLLRDGTIHTTGHYEQPNFHWGDRGFQEEDKGQYETVKEVPSLCGVAILFRKACIEDVGQFDERFVAYYEDVDYSLRCIQKGWKLVYVPKSIVHHDFHATASKLEQGGMPFSRYYTERNRLLLLAKHSPDKLPEAISTFSHFYVEKDYRVLYDSLPVILSVLFDNPPHDLQTILERLFVNLRRIALYESEGIRTERALYKKRLEKLEKEWRRNLQQAVEKHEQMWKIERITLEKKGQKEQKSIEASYQLELAKREKLLEAKKTKHRKELQKEIEKSSKLLIDLHLQKRDLDHLKERELADIRLGLTITHERQTSRIREKLEKEKQKEIIDQREKLEKEKQKEIIDQQKKMKEREKRELVKLKAKLNEDKHRELSTLRKKLSEEKESKLAVQKENSQRDLLRKETNLEELRVQLSHHVRELGSLSAQLALASEHPFKKIADKLRLNVYREGTKESLIRDMKIQLKAKNRDLKIALTKLEQEYKKFRILQHEQEEKVKQYLQAEEQIKVQHADFLDQGKLLTIHRKEIKQLIKRMRDHQGVNSVKFLQQGSHTNVPWIPSISKKESSQDLRFEPLKKPESVHLSIINRCFFRCIHCDIWKNKDENELSTKEIRELLDKLKTWLGPFTLHIAGGEPFMRNDLLDILEYARGLDIDPILTTNGFKVNKRIASKICELNVAGVNVSLDGLEEVHDQIRGVKDSYSHAIKALLLLNAGKNNTKVSVTTVVTSKSLEQLPQLVEWTAENQLNGITFQALCNDFSSEFKWDWWQHTDLWPQNKQKVESIISQLMDMKLAGFPINNSIAQLEHMRYYFLNPGKYPGACRVGLRTLHINEKGDFLLCWNMPPIGNLLKDNPSELWDAAEAKVRRHQIQRCARECFILNCNYL